jgi:hypothetical protein
MGGTTIHDDLLTPLLKKALGWRFVGGAEFGDTHIEIDGAKISYHIDGAFQYENLRMCMACDGLGVGFEKVCQHCQGSGKMFLSTSIGIIEIKSMSDYAFNRALKGEIDHDYLCQAWTYFKGTDFNPVVFLAYRKETSAMVEIVFDRLATEKVVTQRLTGDPVELAKQDPIMLTEIRSPFDESVGEYVRARIAWLKKLQNDPIFQANFLAHPEYVPGKDAVEDEVESVQGNAKCQARAKELGVSLSTVTQNGSWWKIPTGRKILGFPCSYCAHMKRCFPNAKMEMAKDRPIWVVP